MSESAIMLYSSFTRKIMEKKAINAGQITSGTALALIAGFSLKFKMSLATIVLK